MNNLINNSIDEIKNKYKYEIDYTNIDNTPPFIVYGFRGEIALSIKKYNFNERISKITKKIQNENNNLNKIDVESYKKIINEIKNNIEIYKEKIYDEGVFALSLVRCIDYDCEKNKDIKNISNTHIKLISAALDNLREKFIYYEKLFIKINEQLIDIFNKLKINF